MEVGLVGLPASGKTTLFNALAGSHAMGFTDKPHVGMVNIPDPRLDVIAQYIPPQKIIHATIRLVDIPGVPPGSDVKKINSFLEHPRAPKGEKHTRSAEGGTNASKVCLVHLVRWLRHRGFTLLDTQFWNPHLDQFGCIECPRAQYLALLDVASALPVSWDVFRPLEPEDALPDF